MTLIADRDIGAHDALRFPRTRSIIVLADAHHVTHERDFSSIFPQYCQMRFHAQGHCPRRSISLPRIMQRFRIGPRRPLFNSNRGCAQDASRRVIAFPLLLRFSPLTLLFPPSSSISRDVVAAPRRPVRLSRSPPLFHETFDPIFFHAVTRTERSHGGCDGKSRGTRERERITTKSARGSNRTHRRTR